MKHTSKNLRARETMHHIVGLIAIHVMLIMLVVSSYKISLDVTLASAMFGATTIVICSSVYYRNTIAMYLIEVVVIVLIGMTGFDWYKFIIPIGYLLMHKSYTHATFLNTWVYPGVKLTTTRCYTGITSFVLELGGLNSTPCTNFVICNHNRTVVMQWGRTAYEVYVYEGNYSYLYAMGKVDNLEPCGDSDTSFVDTKKSKEYNILIMALENNLKRPTEE